MLTLILLILAVVCLTAAALNRAAVWRLHLGWLGVALFVLTVLIPKL